MIISGFVIAGVSVIVMAIMAYSQVNELSRLVNNPGKSIRYQKYLDGLFDDFDRASLSARNKVLFGTDLDSWVWEQLESQRKDLNTLDTLAANLKDVKNDFIALKSNFLERYEVLKILVQKSPVIGLPKLDSLKGRVPEEELAKTDTLFQALRMDETNVVVIDWKDLWPDTAYFKVVFPKILSYTQENAIRSQEIARLIKEEQRLIFGANVTRRSIERYVQQKRFIGFGDVSDKLGKVTSNIGFASVMVIVLCVLFLIKIIRDIERNRLLEEALRKAKLQAEESALDARKSAKAKEEFLANMSHEMRTPMNAIIGFSSQLAETSLNSDQKSLLQPIRHSAEFLLSLINDILDYSKLEAGKFSLAREHFRLERVVREVSELFVPKAQSKGIDLITEIGENVPEVVIGDELRLKQMLMNLAGNAVKFTDRGSVAIRVKSLNKEAALYKVLFEVEDTGIGIPKEEKERIFEDFIQVDGSNSRRYGGTGLGLSITQKLCKLHGGDIGLESKEGEGTRVQLLLPFEVGKLSEIQENVDLPVNAHPELAGKRVLLADDEPYNRMLVRGLLESWKMEVSSAANGREVLEAMTPPQLYSVLLMDLQMPEMDGIETSLKIREGFSEDIPILALTATSSPREQQRALESGMQGVMLKPFKAQELHDTLLDLLGIEDSKESKTLLNVPTHSDEQPFPELYKVTRGDERMMTKMLEQYLSLTDTNHKALLDAHKSRDGRKLAMISHRMIPANRHLGFQSIVNHLKRIEELGERELFTGELDQLIDELGSWLMGSKEKVKKVLEESQVR